MELNINLWVYLVSTIYGLIVIQKKSVIILREKILK